MSKEMLYLFTYLGKKKATRTLASWYSIHEALDAIIDAILNEDYGLFAGELSNEEGAKVHACAEDRSMKRIAVETKLNGLT